MTIPAVTILATFATHKDGWRWRCALCTGFGFTFSEPSATNDYERHYAANHCPTEETK